MSIDIEAEFRSLLIQCGIEDIDKEALYIVRKAYFAGCQYMWQAMAQAMDHNESHAAMRDAGHQIIEHHKQQMERGGEAQ